MGTDTEPHWRSEFPGQVDQAIGGGGVEAGSDAGGAAEVEVLGGLLQAAASATPSASPTPTAHLLHLGLVVIGPTLTAGFERLEPLSWAGLRW